MMMPWEVFGSFRVEQAQTLLFATDWKQVCKQNPNRIAIHFSVAFPGGSCRLSLAEAAIKTAGQRLVYGSNPHKIHNVSDGVLSQLAWYAIGEIAGVELNVIEVFLERDPCKK